MTEVERLNEVNRQKQALIEMLEAQLIWAKFITQCVQCQHNLERFAKGDFTPEMSRKFDIIQTVLDAEG